MSRRKWAFGVQAQENSDSTEKNRGKIQNMEKEETKYVISKYDTVPVCQ